MTKNKIDELLNSGSKLIAEKKYDEAESVYRQVIDLDSTILAPFTNIGMIELLKGNVDRAVDFLNKALDIDPRNLEAYQNLGSCYLYKDDYDTSEKMYVKALQVDPNNFNTYHNLSSLYIKSQQWTKAKKPLEKILQIDENNYQASFYLGMIYLSSKEYYPAMANFLYTLNIKDDYHTARLGLSDAFYKIGRYKSAITQLEIIIKDLPDFVTPYVKSALIYIETNENEKAVVLLEKATSLNDNNIEIMEILAVLYEEQGNIERAEEIHQQILIKDPENRNAFEAIERIKIVTEKISSSIS